MLLTLETRMNSSRLLRNPIASEETSTQTTQRPPPTLTDLSVTMLRGLLRWGREGSRKGA